MHFNVFAVRLLFVRFFGHCASGRSQIVANLNLKCDQEREKERKLKKNIFFLLLSFALYLLSIARALNTLNYCL
jgi:hypothetical protein